MKKAQIMKKLMMLFTMIAVTTFCSFSLATEDNVQFPSAPEIVENEVNNESNDGSSNSSDTLDNDDISDANLNKASEKVLGDATRKEKRIAELTDKYNDAVFGNVAYYLEVAQRYSIPICFIGITIGAFNFLIIGNKMLDKKEQGFAWIVGFSIGLVIFNVLPLIFALFVAGR